MRNAASKIVQREWLRNKLAEHKKRGQRIVFANGCFDTLHVGHVRYLEGARHEGDILVVGVNADSSVCALKGPGRPILDENARALLVAALRSVDYVSSSANRASSLCSKSSARTFMPKEPTTPLETVPERATAARLGIRVAIVGDPKDHSTRDLLESVRKAPHV